MKKNINSNDCKDITAALKLCESPAAEEARLERIKNYVLDKGHVFAFNLAKKNQQ